MAATRRRHRRHAGRRPLPDSRARHPANVPRRRGAERPRRRQRRGALARRASRHRRVSQRSSRRATRPDAPRSRTAAGCSVILAVFTLSGVVSLALEVVWFRVLTLFLRPTVYGFSVMLATILAGISLGSYIATPLLGRRIRWMTLLAALELAIGIAIVLSFRPLVYLNQLTGELAPALSRVMPEYLVYPIAGSLLAIFPTALLMGIAFPIGLRLWASTGSRQTAERVGLFYSLNVAGAIVGSLAGGFLLLPRFGSEASLALLAAVSFCLRPRPARRRARSRRSAGWRSARSLPPSSAGPSGRRPIRSCSSWRSVTPAPDSSGRRKGSRQRSSCTSSAPGPNSRLLMTINGNHQAGTDFPTTFTHRRIGHLPMVVHPRRANRARHRSRRRRDGRRGQRPRGRRRRRRRARRRRGQRGAAFRGDQLRRPRSPATCTSASTTGAIS